MSEAIGLPSLSRELVCLAPASEPKPLCRTPRATAFLAHLLAAARQVPQARERRRADASEVIAAYRASIARIKELNAQ